MRRRTALTNRKVDKGVREMAERAKRLMDTRGEEAMEEIVRRANELDDKIKAAQSVERVVGCEFTF